MTKEYTDEEAQRLAVESTEYIEQELMPLLRSKLTERFGDDAENVLTTVAVDLIADAIAADPSRIEAITDLVKGAFQIGALMALAKQNAPRS